MSEMAILAVLLVVHMLADFPLQSDWTARYKHKSGWILFTHTLVHGTLTAGLLILVTSTILLPLFFGITVAATHYIIDSNNLSIRWDQTAHLVVLVLLWVLVIV